VVLPVEQSPEAGVEPVSSSLTIATPPWSEQFLIGRLNSSFTDKASS